MKKIALIHYAYPPTIGGVETVVQDHAHLLSDMGNDVIIVTGSGREDLQKIKLIEIPELQSLVRINPSLQKNIIEEGIISSDFYQLAASIRSKLDSVLKDREVIIIHNMMTLVYNLPFISAFKEYTNDNPKKKIIVWVHDHTFIAEEKINLDRSDIRLNPVAQELFMTPITKAHYVVISETFKILLRAILNVSPDRLAVIPNGIHIKEFLEVDDSISKLAKNHSLLQHFPVILSPVKILPRKNIEFSLEILNHLKKRYQSIFLILTGRKSVHRTIGDYEVMIKKKIQTLSLEENTLFLGEQFDRGLHPSELHDLYDLADLVFYFSKSENFGLPVIESSLAKTPIFVSNLKVFRELGVEEQFLIDTQKVVPGEAANRIMHFLETNPIIKLNHRVKRHYDLETILREKLMPLID